MFTNFLDFDLTKQIQVEDLDNYLTLTTSISSIELVPSLLWGDQWDFHEADLSAVTVQVSAIQSLLYKLPILLSDVPRDVTYSELWRERLSKFSLLSTRFPGSVFVLGSPHQRKFRDEEQSEADAIFNQTTYIREILDSLGTNSSLAYENCNSSQGAEFSLGVNGAIQVIKSVYQQRLGLNFDFEAWVIEVGQRWRSDLTDLHAQLIDVPVLNIQLGRTATDLSAMYFLKNLAVEKQSAISIEDNRIKDVSELMNLVKVFTEAN